MRETPLPTRRTAQLNDQHTGHGGDVDTGCLPSSGSKPFQRQRQQQRWRRPLSAPISRAPPPSVVNAPPPPRSDTKQESFGVSYAALGKTRGVGHSVSTADVRAGPTGTGGGRRWLTEEGKGGGRGGGRTEGVWRRRQDEERWRRTPDGGGSGVGGRGFRCLQSRLAEVRGGGGEESEGWFPGGFIGSGRARRTERNRCRVLSIDRTFFP